MAHTGYEHTEEKELQNLSIFTKAPARPAAVHLGWSNYQNCYE